MDKLKVYPMSLEPQSVMELWGQDVLGGKVGEFGKLSLTTIC